VFDFEIRCVASINDEHQSGLRLRKFKNPFFGTNAGAEQQIAGRESWTMRISDLCKD